MEIKKKKTLMFLVFGESPILAIFGHLNQFDGLFMQCSGTGEERVDAK